MAHPLIAAVLAAPKTYRVVTVYASAKVRTHDCRNAMAAETYATGERRKIGRQLIDRDSGAPVRITAVTVEAIHG